MWSSFGVNIVQSQETLFKIYGQNIFHFIVRSILTTLKFLFITVTKWKILFFKCKLLL